MFVASFHIRKTTRISSSASDPAAVPSAVCSALLGQRLPMPLGPLLRFQPSGGHKNRCKTATAEGGREGARRPRHWQAASISRHLPSISCQHAHVRLRSAIHTSPGADCLSHKHTQGDVRAFSAKAPFREAQRSLGQVLNVLFQCKTGLRGSKETQNKLQKGCFK